MVFSRLCPAGTAKLVPYSNTVSTVDDLIVEAEHLWKAEKPNAKTHRIATDWGCVALLCNPERDIPEDLLRLWAERVKRDPDYGNVSQSREEGILNLPGRRGHRRSLEPCRRSCQLLLEEWKNTDNGIGTYQDEQIRAKLRPRGQAKDE
jgi:hypothetical protein